MAPHFHFLLDDRGVLALGGPEAIDFLQNLVTNDVTAAAPGKAVWAALLTPQGRFLHEFFITSDGERLLLDAERGRIPDLALRLKRYRLRAKVTIDDLSETHSVGIAVGAPIDAPLAFPDPRLAELGWRAILPAAEAATLLAATGLPAGTRADWNALRLGLGVPDGSRDLEPERALLMESGFDELGGINWTKGCYIGQELTARMRYRGLVKKRLLPVALDGEAPPPGTLLMAEGREVGEIRSHEGGAALALFRLDALNTSGVTAGDTPVRASVPAWMCLPADKTG